MDVSNRPVTPTSDTTPQQGEQELVMISDITTASLKIFKRDAIEQHNRLRDLHGCPPLTLDDRLSTDCQKYAEQLAVEQKLEHSTGDYGENLAYKMSGRSAKISGTAVTNIWYREIANYKFKLTKDQMNCGHFSQVVWKNTTTVGFGVAFSADKKKVFVVARYKPAGNVSGQFAQNIPRPVSGKIWIPPQEQT